MAVGVGGVDGWEIEGEWLWDEKEEKAIWGCINQAKSIWGCTVRQMPS